MLRMRNVFVAILISLVSSVGAQQEEVEMFIKEIYDHDATPERPSSINAAFHKVDSHHSIFSKFVAK